MDNEKPSIKEVKTVQWPIEKGQIKHGGELVCSRRVNSFSSCVKLSIYK
jgi:hypothetical protein